LAPKSKNTKRASRAGGTGGKKKKMPTENRGRNKEWSRARNGGERWEPAKGKDISGGGSKGA